VTVSATDAFEAFVTVTVSVMIDPVGDRPELESGGTFEAFERSPFTHTFTVTDVDLPDDDFTFSDTPRRESSTGPPPRTRSVSTGSASR
jgi:hypothetical protein